MRPLTTCAPDGPASRATHTGSSLVPCHTLYSRLRCHARNDVGGCASEGAARSRPVWRSLLSSERIGVLQSFAGAS